MDSYPTETTPDFGENKSRSPLRKITEKNTIGRMLARTKLSAKNTLEDSFEMISDFGSPARKRAREVENHPSYLNIHSPDRKRRDAPPVAYRSPKLIPPRLDSIPIPPTPPKDYTETASGIPLPHSPLKSASSWSTQTSSLSRHPGSTGRPETPISQTSGRKARTAREISHAPPPSPSSPDIFVEFDQLFADFPHPPPGAPVPALSTGSASSYASSSSSSRPATPSENAPPDPARLESAINTLSQVVLCLQGTQADHAAYALRQSDLVDRLHGMERELGGVRAKNLRLAVEVKREREERARVEKERESLKEEMERNVQKAESECARAKASLSELQSQAQTSTQNIQSLQSHLTTSRNHSTNLESRNRTLESEISRLTAAFDMVKENYKVKEEEMRKRMEEAEFMHQALKESGARLGRELEGARKKYSELEKKGRGGYI